MKKELFQKTTSVLMVFALIVSLFSVRVSATNNNFDNAQLESNDLINGDLPAFDEIEAWYNQQPVQNLNPDYVKYLQDVEYNNLEEYVGDIPSALPVIDGEFSNQSLSRTVLPTKYDPRSAGLVTSVKQQSPITGVSRDICWSYASMSTVESYLLKQGIERDYSENYYNYYFAENAFIDIQENPCAHLVSDKNPDTGITERRPRKLNEKGNSSFVFQAMLNGIGPVLQTEFPDSITTSIHSSLMNISPDMLLLGYDSIGGLTADASISSLSAKIQKIKQTIIDNGAVTLSYCVDTDGVPSYRDSQYYSNEHYAWYVPNNLSISSNHGVSLVGWDDSFSKNNFNAQNRPPADGAFIIKNSWGTNSGDNGYFYISYYDLYIYKSVMYSVSLMDNINLYDRIYSPISNEQSIVQDYTLNSVYISNTFSNESLANESITTVGFEVAQANTQYEIYINPNDSEIYVPALKKAAEGTADTPGYHTIYLDSPVFVESGASHFSVIVKLTAPNDDNLKIMSVPSITNDVISQNSVTGWTWYPFERIYNIRAYSTTCPNAHVP